jgi:hypothetical protein
MPCGRLFGRSGWSRTGSLDEAIPEHGPAVTENFEIKTSLRNWDNAYYVL